jgi:hypothetical protein
MMRRLHQGRVLHLVAFSADVRLCGRVANGILYVMHFVATGARHVVRSVRARGPIVCGVRLVTSQAHLILLCDGRLRADTEVNDAGRLPPFRFYVCTARPMASLALQASVSERAPQVIGECVPGSE